MARGGGKPGRLAATALRLCILLVLALAGCDALRSVSQRDTLLPSRDRQQVPSPDDPAAERVAGPGIGGTGQQVGKPGIGGTGIYAGRAPGIGGTGIVGTITGFGSIFVNGFEIDYPSDMVIPYMGRTMRPDGLRIGQVVEIETDGEGTRLRARAIAVHHEVAGPIERIDRKARTLVILGQTVAVPQGALIAGRDSRAVSFADLSPGDVVDVSGLRRHDGAISASRLDESRPGGPAFLRGTVTAVDRTGFTIGRQRVEAPQGARSADVAVGRDVSVVGAPARGRMRARRVDVASRVPFAGRVRRLSVEGYVGPQRGGAREVGSIPVTGLPAGSSVQTGQRVIMDAAVDERGRVAPAKVRRTRLKLQRQRRRVAPPPDGETGGKPRNRKNNANPRGDGDGATKRLQPTDDGKGGKKAKTGKKPRRAKRRRPSYERFLPKSFRRSPLAPRPGDTGRTTDGLTVPSPGNAGPSALTPGSTNAPAPVDAIAPSLGGGSAIAPKARKPSRNRRKPRKRRK